MAYRVQLSDSARRELLKLSGDLRRRIQERIDTLAEDPRPAGVKKLKGEKNGWRVRVGDYRIIYEIHDAVLLVYVVEIGHRGNVYR